MKLASSRVRQIKPSGIRVIWERSLKLGDVIRMELGEPDFDTPYNIKQAAKEALDNGYTHYTPSVGILELREAIARKLKRENNIDVNPEDEVIVTSGACSALYLALLATIDAGDEVLIPDPGWPHYEPDVLLAGGVPIRYPLNEDNDFRVDLNELRGKISSKTRTIIINTPNNPTGSVMNRKELEEVAQLAVEHDLLVISDEVYEKIVFDDNEHVSLASLPGMKERTITINALSKTYAMTGWRLGYAAARPEIIAEMAKLNLYSTTCANAAAQVAGIEALNGPQDEVHKMVEEYKRRRDVLVKGLNEVEGINCKKPMGTFYTFPSIAELKARSLDFALYLLDDAHVSTVPGSAFGELGEYHLRASFTLTVDKIEQAIERIRESVKKFRRRGD